MFAMSSGLRSISLGLRLGLGLAVPMMTGCADNMGAYDRVEVDVTGHGTGTGTVSASDPAVDIECTITAGTSSGTCHASFPEAGQGGVFTLTATPSAGSSFDGFSGCTSAAGNVCTLSFEGTGNNITFSVGVTFTLLEGPPAGMDVVSFYNNAAVSAHLLGPGEAVGAGNLVISHGQRDVAIDTTVGSTAMFRAYNAAATLLASISCQVTVEAWTVPSPYPLVILNDNEGYYLTCSSGLVAP